MPKQTHYVRSLNAAHSHLLRGFNKTLDNFGKVPLGHNVLDSRTMENRFQANLVGMTAGLPLDSRKIFQRPGPKIEHLKGGQSDKAKAAGVVVDPTAVETAQGADGLSVDTTGGYGITPSY